MIQNKAPITVSAKPIFASQPLLTAANVQEGQEGKWEVCFATQDSLSVSMEIRCVFLNVQRCYRCVRHDDHLETLGQLYNSHWLELYTVNPSLHRSRPGSTACGRLMRMPMYETSVCEQWQSSSIAHFACRY